MNSRERVLAAMDGLEPDRIPRALSFYALDPKALFPKGVFRQDWIDVLFVDFPLPPAQRSLEDAALPYAADTRLGTVSQMRTYTRWQYRLQDPGSANPLAAVHSLEELAAFPFPKMDRPYATKALAKQVRRLHEAGLAVGGNLPHLGGELFETAWRLRGLENFLIDLAQRPEWARYLLDRLTDLACGNAETLAAAGVDILALDDDVGMPGSMMISPAMWGDFFEPRLRRIIQHARGIRPDLRVLFHSDGYFEPILPSLMEIGVNAINPLQPEHMDAARIRKRFGSRLAFWGTVGAQTTFSFSTPEAIRAEVKDRIETLGRAGFILCPAYDIDEPDIPWQNIVAFLEAGEAFG
jgi:uroporphyrinogen decarboxylase